MNISAIADEELMKLFSKNTGNQSKQAFDCLYKRYSKKLLEYFYFMFNKDRPKAQDFLHELFLKIIERPGSFDNSKKFSSWIFSIAANMCKNEFRRISIREDYRKDFLFVNSPSAGSDAYEKQLEDRDVLRKAISLLDSDQKTILILRYRFDLSIKEIAGITDIPEGTVKSRLFYAIRSLSGHFTSTI
jgi:RNA polymerase sigma-70 factor, ECF subfamily